MIEEPTKFTHIGVKKSTQRKVAILAKVLDDTDMYSLVEFWANTEWENALKAGLVTDAMLTQKRADKQSSQPKAIDKKDALEKRITKVVRMAKKKEGFIGPQNDVVLDSPFRLYGKATKIG